MAMDAETGLADLVGRYRRRLFAVALARTEDVDVADDVVQTVLTRVAARGALDGVTNPPAYLVQAVVNQCRNAISRARPTVPLPEETPASDLGAPSRAVEERELGGLLRGAIRGLPPAYRTVVWLVHVEGLTPGEAAEAVGSPPATTKSALARGRRLLRERLGPVLRKAGYLEV